MPYNARAPLAQPPANTYTPHEMMGLLQVASQASEQHLFAAAVYVTEVLGENRIIYALMGGFSLRLRRSSRATQDVDIAVGCDMNTLLGATRSKTSIRRPAGPTAGVVRVFVTVGGDADSGITQHIVGVTLILQGSLGAPDDLSTASERVTVTFAGGQREFMLLNIKGILIAKLGAFFARISTSDIHDLEFLGRNMADQIYAMRQQLNAEHRQAFINAYSRGRISDSNRVRRMKHVYGVV